MRSKADVPLQAALRYTLAVALGTSFTLVAFLGTSLVGLILFFGVSQLLRSELAHRLGHVTGITAIQVDAGRHWLLRKPDDDGTEYYRNLRAALRSAQSQSDDVAYVYTVRLAAEGEPVWTRDDDGALHSRAAAKSGEVVFVVDADPVPESAARIGQVYEDAPVLLRTALKGEAEPNHGSAFVSSSFYTDGWGTFLSGYAPVRDGTGRLEAMLCTDISAAAVLAHERDYKLIVIAMCALVTLVTVPVSLRFASWIRRPLQELGKEMGRIERLDIDAGGTVSSRIVEVNRMARELDNMKNSLRSFRKYVPARLVSRLMELGVEAELGGTREEVTIFFSDIAGFTSVSEKLSPEKLVEFLGEYLNTVTDTLLNHEATVDKYIGDAVMAFWNAPVHQADHALLACKAALDCRKDIDRLNERWTEEGRGVVFRTRIGVHTGDVIVGNMGSAQRLAYTIMGDNVNLASRLEGANKAYGTESLITGATYELVKSEILARRIDRVAVIGKTIPVDFYELIGLRSEAGPLELERVARYEQGFELYLAGRFGEASNVFHEILENSPEDLPAKLLHDRCLDCRKNPPAAGWNGSHALTEK